MGSERFEPALCGRRFVIVSADYAVVTIAPTLIRELSRLAPKASVHFVDMPHPTLEPHVGEMDFFVVPEFLFREGGYPPLHWTPLIEDEFVTVVPLDHPLAELTGPNQSNPLAERYVLYYPALSLLDTTMISAVTGQTQGRHIVAQIQQFSLLPALAIDTGCAAIMPRRIAEYMRRFMPIRLIEDASPPVRLDLCLAWNAAHDSDPAHRWFRKLVTDHCTMKRDQARVLT
jgi:DNA-binding transcriptional LysR family regulator